MIDWRGQTVVYTAVAGDYDHMGSHILADGVDYKFFTTGESRPVQSEWQVEQLPDLSHLHPRRVAKLPKTFPHFFRSLERYNYAIWIDGDMQIISDQFVPQILSFMTRGMVVSPHFDNRHCAYGEATIRPSKYASEPMDAQVEWYQQDGFPTEQGLYEGGVIARDMNSVQVKEVGMLWYIHNMTFSYQDQVSLPYCFWRTGYQPDVLPDTFRNMRWVQINAHKSEL